MTLPVLSKLRSWWTPPQPRWSDRQHVLTTASGGAEFAVWRVRSEYGPCFLVTFAGGEILLYRHQVDALLTAVEAWRSEDDV